MKKRARRNGAAKTAGHTKFLQALFGKAGGLVEFRFLPSGEQVFCHWNEKTTITQSLERYRHENQYVGVATRRDGTSGALTNCVQLSALFVDIDFKTTPEPEARRKLAECPWAPSMVVASGGGLHAYWFLSEPLDLTREAPLAKDLLRRLAYLLSADLAAAEPARILRRPGSVNHKYIPPRPVSLEAVHPERRYTASEFDELLPRLPNSDIPNGTRQSFRSPETICDGERNTTLYRTGRSMKAKGLGDTAIREALRAENVEKCQPPLPESEIDAILHSVLTQADAPGFAALGQIQPCTDVGNGRRFRDQHHDTVRWCPKWNAWLNFDSMRWARDEKGVVMKLAKKTARSIADEAQSLPNEKDDQRRKLLSWAIASEHHARLKAMVELAKSEDGMTVAPEDLDCDPWLLNTLSGIVDLRTGDLLPHDRTQLLSKLAPIQYDPSATCTTWLAFLCRIMANDQELIDFLQRSIGYSLTASVRDRVLFLLHGTGANGKSTLTRILLSLLGDYALQTPSDTLLASRHDGGIRNDLARLSGARVVAALESDGGRRLASALIKQLTGNDKVTARFLFGEYFEFSPTWKIWFSTNHRPSVSDNGDAIWDRIKLIPFEVRIPEGEQDKELLTKLIAELPGILAWAVEGCRLWQRGGLGNPKKVTAATKEYRDSESTFDQFLLEWCVCDDPKARVSFAELRAAYVKWTEDSSDYTMSTKAMAAALQERGFKSTRVNYARFYEGLALRPGLLAVNSRY